MKADNQVVSRVTGPRSRRHRLAASDQGEAILRAATDLFLRSGYGAVSIDAINRSSGGSKRDLYQLFGDKEALFRRVVVDLCRECVDALSATLPREQDLEASLTLAGEAFLDMLMAPKTVALHRLLVSEGVRFPEVAADFLRQGPSSAYAAFAKVLRTHAEAGDMDVEDESVAARLFLDSLSGSLQLRALMGESIDEREIKAIVGAAVAAFMRGMTVRSGHTRRAC